MSNLTLGLLVGIPCLIALLIFIYRRRKNADNFPTSEEEWAKYQHDQRTQTESLKQAVRDADKYIEELQDKQRRDL